MNIENFTIAEIDLDAIRRNVRGIRNILPASTAFMAVVKADGYGHGASQTARAAISAGASCLGVASIREALELRSSGVNAPVLILSESNPAYAEEIVRHGLMQTVYTERLIAALSKAAVSIGKKAVVHFKVDTGMGRIGARPDEALEVLRRTKGLPGIEFEGVFTHFAKADDRRDGYTKRQISIFDDFLRSCSSLMDFRVRHSANSAAVFNFPASHMDMVRVGLAMYGLPPAGGADGVDLMPALSFKTKVVYVKRVKRGDRLSYGGTYRAGKDIDIATIPVGYADGYGRGLSNKGVVLIGGRRCRVAGRVCMDLTLVEMRDAGCEVGDEVILIGKQGSETITADDIANALGTINYEVVCGIGKRVPRIYKN